MFNVNLADLSELQQLREWTLLVVHDSLLYPSNLTHFNQAVVSSFGILREGRKEQVLYQLSVQAFYILHQCFENIIQMS